MFKLFGVHHTQSLAVFIFAVSGEICQRHNGIILHEDEATLLCCCLVFINPIVRIGVHKA